jgi:hypothetical protein
MRCMLRLMQFSVKKLRNSKNDLPTFVHTRGIFVFDYMNLLKINEMVKCFSDFSLSYCNKIYFRDLNTIIYLWVIAC